MATVHPYLVFNGQCEEAFLFYKSVFGGEFPYVGRFGDMPQAEGQLEITIGDKDKIMHISLPIGNDTILMGSDTNATNDVVKMGDNISLSINAASREEADHLFNGLSAGGIIKMPMSDTFWDAYFGMFTDKFGINWLVNFDFVKP
ncbi:MAG: VOC family protein [Flavobacterium sp.]|nr:VOC family protein [Flavobacterium sp.]